MTEVDNLVAAGAATALAAALATAAAAAALATHQHTICGVVLAARAILAAGAVLACGTVLAADGHFFYIHNQHFFSASPSKRFCCVTSLNLPLLLGEQHQAKKNALRLQQCR